MPISIASTSALPRSRRIAISASPTTFGAANTIFYLGYMAFEVSSNLLLARFGARTWRFRRLQLLLRLGIPVLQGQRFLEKTDYPVFKGPATL